MADTLRRQAPSPLTFSPAPPLQSQSSTSSAHSMSSTNISMPFIKRHVTRRLKAAKAECDKELTALTHAITSFFEDKLRESDYIRDVPSETTSVDDSDRESRRPARDSPSNLNATPLQQQQEFDIDDLTSEDEALDPRPEVETLSRRTSGSAASSPVSLRRHSTYPRDLSRGAFSHPPGETSPLKSQELSDPHMQHSPLLPPQIGGIHSRRLSRSFNRPTYQPQSAASSRSTSRSRSPMPGFHGGASEFTAPRAYPANRRSSRYVDEALDPFIMTLHIITELCNDIIDMPLSTLTNSPNTCADLVEKVQKIGHTWDEHPDWHGRAWYVQLLLTVAGLSRVVEWWEAEKQFWHFDEDDATGTPGEDEKAEPLNFVLKHADVDDSFIPSESSTIPTATPGSSSDGRRSRDELQKQLHLFDQAKGTENEAQLSAAPAQEALAPSPMLDDGEKLQEEVERAQSMNIVLELALDGDHLIWVNDAWRTVIGSDPEQVPGISLSQLLSPGDSSVFSTAAQRLQEDDFNTVEVEFKLRVIDDLQGEPMYRRMEGKGMLMFDRIDGIATHSMWVIKPLSDPEPQSPRGEPAAFELDAETSRRRAMGPHINLTEILCRICEFKVPQWYFEKHSETCHETHKLEADVGECNDSIAELRNSIRELTLAIDKGGSTPLEYRGIPLVSPVSPPVRSGPLQLFRPPLAGKLQRMGVKKLQKRLLESLDDILQVAAEVSVPSLKDDESNEPIERQRLLSPSSERKISTIRTWSKPVTEDPALSKLVNDADTLMKAKLDTVVRMQNTVRYAEKVRQEWEQKVQEYISREELKISDENESDGESSSSGSDYAAGGEGSGAAATAIPTPTAPAPSLPVPLPGAVPKTYQGRISTPSATSSPLALATPIVPSSPIREEPALELPEVGTITKQLSTKSSLASLGAEPRLVITPPATPSHTGLSLLHRRHSSAAQKSMLSGPASPRIASVPPSARASPSSIKDFEIIKPISKGAFGSVFLAKKKVTGDYYAIKVLKKSDMIAKNQITNVKAERMILMKQSESPFVVKLFWTFQSRDNLYLVMEYLNGGDCAALIKVLGCLPEEWTRNYIAEVVLGLEYLHDRGVTHRDLKPDNLLIDQHGHLKLTDFGLSRIGLLGRQTRDPNNAGSRYNSRPPSMDSVYLSSPMFSPDAQLSNYFGLRTYSNPQLVPHTQGISALDDVDSSGSENASGAFPLKRGASYVNESPLQSFASELATDLRSHVVVGSGVSGEHKVVGTPDYLAPETILAISKDDRMVDWWALGVITYEFLYGFPPFHSDSPDQVFENILSGKIDWHDEYVDLSEETRDFIKRLLNPDPSARLGAGGPEEVKAHPFLRGIDWANVTTQEAQFIPQVTDPESTDYFDPRGAKPQVFPEDEPPEPPKPVPVDERLSLSVPVPIAREPVGSPSSDDFGAFSFKNLGVLKQANDDVIRKLKTEHMQPLAQTLSETNTTARRKSLSQRIRKPPSVLTGSDSRSSSMNPPTNPPSPSTSASSVASSPSYSSMGPSTPGSYGSHARRTSEYGVLDRFKLGTQPSRLRTASVSSVDPGSGSDQWPSPIPRPVNLHGSSESSADSAAQRRSSQASQSDRAVTVLIAEDNPISAKILETILTRMGCRCIVVSDGSEAVSVAQGDIKFDVIMLDLNMPIIDGEDAAKYIKSTNSKNTNTPIISVSAYTGIDAPAPGELFVASLTKPVQRAELVSTLRNLGFRTTAAAGSKPTSGTILPR